MPDQDDDAGEVTTVKVTRETWRRLNRRKERPRDSFDDVISELLDKAEEDEQGNRTAVHATAD